MRGALVLGAVTALSSGSTNAFLAPKAVAMNVQLSAASSGLQYLAIDIREGAKRDVESMEQWAYSNGLQSIEGFQLVGNEIDGHLDVSAMTNEDVPANTPVMYIPNEMILSSDKAMAEFGRYQEAEEVIRKNDAESELRQYYLMLKILYEVQLGEESPYYHYLNSLPRFFSGATSMSPLCYRCVPPLVGKLAQKERATMNHLFVKRVPFLSDDIKGNGLLWKWAFEIVYTRSFEANDGSGDLRIVPMGDMFNHGAEAEVEYAYDEYGNCYIQTTKDVPAGSPLRMAYADPTNPSFLFARYGFLDEESPATFCKILPSHVSQEMIDIGYAQNRLLFYTKTGEVSEEVWDVLLYQLLGEVGGGKQHEFYHAHIRGDYDEKQKIHEEFYPQTSAKLLEHIDTFLSDLDELEWKAYHAGEVAPDDHPRLPLITRHNQFVRNAFLAVRSRYFG